MSTIWDELFSKSVFVGIPAGRAEEVRASFSRGSYLFTQSYSEKRQKDFFLGRFCAAEALRTLHYDTAEIPTSEDRSPVWPLGVVGSISHSAAWTGAAVARSTDLIAMGIDFEAIGRVNEKTASTIINAQDITQTPGLTQLELWTLIFSAKESLFKALHPLHKKFFYFDAAAVTAVNATDGHFVISLLPAHHHLAVDGKTEFAGRFKIAENQCLSVLEIPSI